MSTIFNKKSFLLLQLSAFALFSVNSHAAEKTIEATISGYECGDNCYLEIIDSDDGEMIGLCTAPLCEAWNMEAAMPEKYIGKKVRIVIGEAQQFDAEGNVMGTMESFTSIELLD
ncbi:MAG: hypothetical protein GQ569_00050 [Methylococcaceae bacterium]|nr:hypothetical protein [Methylococcaceae bacterium]